MSDAVLVDDHLLLEVLIGRELTTLRSDSVRIATTGLWYHRACRAWGNTSVVGSLTRRLSGLAPAVVSAVIASVIELPKDIEIVSLRTLGWPMAELLSDGLRLNLMSLEAITAARAIGADIWLAASNRNERLASAASELGLPVRTIDI